MPEQPRKHGQCRIGERLIHEGLLPLQGFEPTARWKFVLAVEFRIDQFGEKLGSCGQAPFA